jgi:MFS family permease
MAMVLDVSTRANRGRLTGLYSTWMWVGFGLGPLLGGFLVDIIAFRPAMLTLSGITAVGLVVALVALPETSQPRQRATGPEAREQSSPRGRLSDGWRRRTRTFLRANRSLATPMWMNLILQFTGEGVVLSTLSLLLQQRFGQWVALGGVTLGVASAGGVLLALRSLLAGVAGPVAGHLSDAQTGRWPLIAASFAVGVLGFGVLSFATSAWALALGVALAAISGGSGLAMLAAGVGDLTPAGRKGTVMGAYVMAGDVGSMAGPFLAFALLSVVDLKWVYLLCAFVLLIGLYLLRRRRGAQYA